MPTYTFTLSVPLREIADRFGEQLADDRDDFVSAKGHEDLNVTDWSVDHENAYIAEGCVEFPVTVTVGDDD